jgi:WRKY transcription factor 29
MEGWDLQAVVRGCIDEAPAAFLANPESLFAPLRSVKDFDLLSFPEISDTRTVLDELENLYKPFYSVSSQANLASSASSISVPKELKEAEQQQIKKKQTATHRRIRLVIWCKSSLIPT